MNVGSRVTTPNGEGTLKRFVIDERWSFGRPDVIRWAGVQLDHKDFVQLFHPAHVKEAPMNETIEQPVDEPTTEPDPEPEPTEPDPEGDDEKLIEFPE